MSKNDKTYVIYFVELCTAIISNVSNNFQTQRNNSVTQFGLLSIMSYSLQKECTCTRHRHCGWTSETQLNSLNWLLFSFKPYFYNMLFRSWSFLSISFNWIGLILVIRSLDFSYREISWANISGSSARMSPRTKKYFFYVKIVFFTGLISVFVCLFWRGFHFYFLCCFFLLLATDQNIRLYDTTRGRFHLQQTVKARDVGWSVLDVCFTPDTQHVLYSSWSDYSKASGPVRYCMM